MTYAEIRQRDPYTYDHVLRYGARALKRAGSASALAKSQGVSRSRAAHRQNGDPSCATEVLATFAVLAGSPDTTAVPLLAEAWAITMRKQVCALSNGQLKNLHRDLTHREHHAEARESLRTADLHDDSTPDDLDDAADADMEEAEMQILRAQVRREIAERKRNGRWT